jgi:hypothetical protein
MAVALVESRGISGPSLVEPEMDAPSNAPACLVLAGFCFLLSDTPAAAHASSKPRSEGRSALTQLRAAGEAAWGGGPMPAALDDEAQTQTPSPNPNP